MESSRMSTLQAGTGLEASGIQTSKPVHVNLPPAVLYEHAIRRHEGLVAADGPLVCRTGAHTGRSPNDKFVVQEPSTEANIWWGKVNRPMQVAHYDALRAEVVAHLGQQELFVQDLYAGADPAYRLGVRFVQEYAWQNLFVRNLFIVPPAGDLPGFQPQFTVLTAPSFKADPARHGSRSDVVIAVNLAAREVIIAGTSYAGENKKSIFTVLNYVLPLQNVLAMHCSANIGPGGDTALFFGLSGTGKTTLSSDPDRRLIGDDEHGWSDRGVFNFEGGCYAKMIKLSAEAEPQIFATTHRFGTVLENVVIDPATRLLNFDDGSLTENTRGAYPIEFIDNAVLEGMGGHPENIVMLTADAYGVLPPIARLSPEGAMYHYLSGYTAKVAGTEKGVTEPSATFSTCFGAPFLPLNPNVYAKQLGERIARYQSRVWLVNTGWTGGAYGVGHRMKIAHTRSMIRAALSGGLDQVGYQRHPIFNIEMPTECPDVPSDVLDPRGTWSDPAAYDQQATKLAAMFVENFKTFEAHVAPGVKEAGPRV
jgi:phosphoenolpyruvate carboxykinase (ATP)